jgi:Tfp pilus assembly protein PilE
VAARGFSLIEMLLVLCISIILLALATWLYPEQQKRAHRHAAAVLLQKNAVYLEQYYSLHGSYKQSAAQWPDLPFTQYPPQGPALYSLGFSSLPRNTDNGYYSLRATALDDQQGYIELAQTGTMKHCVSAAGQETCRLL